MGRLGDSVRVREPLAEGGPIDAPGHSAGPHPTRSHAYTRPPPFVCAGFPVFAAQPHLERLVRAGHRVALCEQMADTEAGSGLLRRCVTRIVTPGASPVVSTLCVAGWMQGMLTELLALAFMSQGH